MAKLNEGEVAISIEGNPFVLKPTLRAMTAINSQFGGMAAARKAVVEQDFFGVIGVIRHGVGMTDAQAINLSEAVFRNGMTGDLLVPLIRYLGILANGGRPLPDDPGAGSAEGNES